MNRPSPDDAGLWRRAMDDGTPLRGHHRHRRHPASPAVDAGKMPAVPTHTMPRDGNHLARRLQRQPEPLDRFAGVDRATAERVKRGRYPVAARLDLHGMTQDEAHAALHGFVAAS